ncbi:MAG: polysaccharide biosynthesis/export family protein [Paludibacteraceae bacterium]|nr:polysaccharide biosynthesis/export family protein [Paludibacteraceae bacterium]
MKHLILHIFYQKQWVFLFCIFLFSACVTSKQINYLQELSKNQIPKDTLINLDYKIQRGDNLYIKIFSTDETANKIFNTTNSVSTQLGTLYSYPVYEDGTIDIPFIEPVFVQGKTLRDAKNIIEEQLKKILSNVSVNTSILNKTFSIIGESGCGRYSMPKEKINIFQALALSGDLTTYADRKNIKIIRQTENGETKIHNIDIRNKDIINSEFYYIQPNDVIYVPHLTEKTFGITHFTGILSTTLSTISLIATIVNLGILLKPQ